MARLIDAEALREVIEDHVTTVSMCPTVDWARGKRQMQEIALEDIDNAPTIDAAPVVHARWIQYEPDLHGTKPLECGACHYLFARLYPRDFCPHCGAKMDGGANDAEQ